MAPPEATTPALSVVIPALDSVDCLANCLDSLDAAHDDTEIIVVDGGSRDGTAALAESLGARVLMSDAGRGAQLVAGAAAARGRWLLFLHADTRLSEGWRQAATVFMAAGDKDHAGYFHYALDDDAPAARRLEALVAWRCRLIGLPYGDQGLLIGREFYQRLGGFRPLPLMEDVEFIRRIGRRRLVLLDAEAMTSAARYRRGGYLLRPVRNLACLALYFLGLPPRSLVRLYG